MKITLVCLALAVIVAVAECCNSDHECGQLSCNHGMVGTCIGHQCACTHPHGKRDGGCTVDADCASFDCSMMPGTSAVCIHHGPVEHGHGNCLCQ